MGAFKRLDDVPDDDRLQTYADRYDGVDVWAAFVASRSDAFDSAYYQDTLRRTEQSWKDHMADRGRHHALATPQDVATWCETILADRTVRTALDNYFVRVEQLYTWLQFHTDHPHCYHPVLMAAATADATRTIWLQKFARDQSGHGDHDD